MLMEVCEHVIISRLNILKASTRGGVPNEQLPTPHNNIVYIYAHSCFLFGIAPQTQMATFELAHWSCRMHVQPTVVKTP